MVAPFAASYNMQTALKTIVAILALTVTWFGGHPEVGSHEAAPGSSAPPSDPRGPWRGMAVQLHCNSQHPNVYDHYHKLLTEIKALGADTVLLVVHVWQEHAGSLDLHLDPHRTPKPKDLGRLLDAARGHGLRVVLMPVVLLKNPRNNEWRGQIVPKDRDWDTWFKRYTQVIIRFAKLAERHGVEAMTIGSELIKAEPYAPRWRRLIEEVRQNYRGRLGYSANWDHYQTNKIGFWPELDFVGMTTYYKLADGPNPTAAELDRNWAPIKREIKAFQREVNKPIVFTEAGWCSQDGAASEAWNYYHSQEATPTGHAEQVACYEAFIRTWSGDPVVGGIIWWEWDNTAGGKDDYNYTPRGKPAEAVLRRWFAEGRERKPGPEPAEADTPPLDESAP